MKIEIEVAPGELIDRVTILEIKSERVHDTAKLLNINRERMALAEVMQRVIAENSDIRRLQIQLKATNIDIWNLEDMIRDCERLGDFGEEFIKCARGIYRTNDRRATLKREINVLMGSEVLEEKSYAAY